MILLLDLPLNRLELLLNLRELLLLALLPLLLVLQKALFQQLFFLVVTQLGGPDFAQFFVEVFNLPLQFLYFGILPLDLLFLHLHQFAGPRIF